MKTKSRKRQTEAPEVVVVLDPTTTIFSSDLLTPEEERELLALFWECKNELVRSMLRGFPKLRAHRPTLEPWPMAQFIRDYCDPEVRHLQTVRHIHDRYMLKRSTRALSIVTWRSALVKSWPGLIRATLPYNHPGCCSHQSHLIYSAFTPHSSCLTGQAR